MGIFYHPPQPTQAASHVPIPSQGEQPPRYSIVNTMQVVGVSWPKEHEPRRHPVNIERAKTVPLTLVYGDQPPVRFSIEPLLRATWVDLSWSLPPQRYSAAWNTTVVTETTIRHRGFTINVARLLRSSR